MYSILAHFFPIFTFNHLKTLDILWLSDAFREGDQKEISTGKKCVKIGNLSLNPKISNSLDFYKVKPDANLYGRLRWKL